MSAKPGTKKSVHGPVDPKIRNIRISVEYDGANYFGFQYQPGKPTIQKEIEKALKRLLGKALKISAASGRTDSGVHAACQVVNFKVVSLLDLHRIQMGLNYYLPSDISVIEAAEADPEFHARYSAKSKVYEYRIWNHRVRSPLRATRFYHVPFPLNVRVMQAAAKHLVGRHDFSSFCSTGGVKRDPVKHVKKLSVSRDGDEILICIEADGFLYHMVRNIAGTLIEAGRGKVTSQTVRTVLHARGKKRALSNAPGHALTLVSVTY